MTSKVIIETQYLPTIAFYAYYLNIGRLAIEQHENYQKGGYRNRTTILSSQGPLTLSVPLKKGKNKQLSVREVRIDYTSDWIKLHLSTLQSCYGKSAFIEHYIQQLAKIYQSKPEFLFDLNLRLISTINKWLNLTNEIELTDAFYMLYNDGIMDRRNFISPKLQFKGILNSDFTFTPYEQVFSENMPFQPNLSILDLLFCQGPEAVLYLKRIYNIR